MFRLVFTQTCMWRSALLCIVDIYWPPLRAIVSNNTFKYFFQNITETKPHSDIQNTVAEPGIANGKKEEISKGSRGMLPQTILKVKTKTCAIWGILAVNLKKSSTLKFMTNIQFCILNLHENSQVHHLNFIEKNSMLADFFPTENIFLSNFRFSFPRESLFLWRIPGSVLLNTGQKEDTVKMIQCIPAVPRRFISSFSSWTSWSTFILSRSVDIRHRSH